MIWKRGYGVIHLQWLVIWWAGAMASHENDNGYLITCIRPICNSGHSFSVILYQLVGYLDLIEGSRVLELIFVALNVWCNALLLWSICLQYLWDFIFVVCNRRTSAPSGFVYIMLEGYSWKFDSFLLKGCWHCLFFVVSYLEDSCVSGDKLEHLHVCESSLILMSELLRLIKLCYGSKLLFFSLFYFKEPEKSLPWREGGLLSPLHLEGWLSGWSICCYQQYSSARLILQLRGYVLIFFYLLLIFF